MARHLVVLLLSSLFLGTAAHAQTTREVSYNPRSVVPVHARLRFTTMIILPEDEEILDFVCGDKDFWVVSGAENLAYVKPAKAGAATNLNLVTASGRVYSFLLTEAAAEPDLKVYVTPDEPMKTAANGTKKFYSAAQVEELRRTATDAKTEAEDAKREAEEAKASATKAADERVNAFRSAYPTRLRFSYRFKANEKRFAVSAIYTDGTFTFIQANASELPSLYEVREGAPNLVNFQVENGVYVVPKVLERGYLAIGKQRFAFEMAR
jgi:type IV secretory pathway VirB9-like protein